MLLLATWAVVFALLAIPAAATHAWLVRRGVQDERVRLVAPLVAVGVAGYVAFFAYFLHPLVGQVYSFLTLGGLAAYAVRARGKSAGPGGDHGLFLTALLASGIGLFYLALLYLPDLGRAPEWQSQTRFLLEFPIDSCLPQFLGDKLYAGIPPKPFLPDAGWLSSDRPPLQAGLYLLVRPWLGFARIPLGLGYQCVGTFAQLCWLPAVWMVTRALGLGRHRSTAVVLLVAATGFALFNSTFVWPKLLAAGFIMMAGGLLLDRDSPRPPAVVGLAAATAGLGWLSHGAAAFSLGPLALVLLLPRYFPGVRNCLLAAVIFGGLALPWSAYQKFYDPPANRLLKWHLAGVIPIDDRTTWEALRDSYGSLPREVLIDNKLANFGTITKDLFGQTFDIFTSRASDRKVAEYFYVFRSLGILNLAWLLAPLAWLGQRRLPPRFGLQAALLGWTLLTIVTWALAMFIACSTILQSSSYAMVLALFVLAIIFLLQLPRWLGLPVLAWHVIGFAVTWLPYYHAGPPLSGMMFGLLALATGWLAWLVAQARNEDLPSWAAAAASWRRWRETLVVPAGTYPLRAALLTAAAVVLVLFFRRPEAFLHPQFWAEDGSIFFLQADFLGPSALTQSYGGYHHFLLRLVAAAATGLDVLWRPAAYFWASIAIVVVVVLALFSPRLDLPHRSLFALAIVLVPHSGEVFHNLTNAQWVAALGLVLLLLARDGGTVRQQVTDAVAAGVLGLTGVFSILFAPFFLWRAWRRRTFPAWLLAGLVVAAAVAQVIALQQGALPHDASGGGDGLVRSIGLRIWGTLLLSPTLANAVPTAGLVAGGILATMALVLAGRRQDSTRAIRLMLWGCLGAILASVAYKFRGDYLVLTDAVNGDRYFFLPKVLVAWLLILEWDGPWRWAARAACGLALIASLTAFQFVAFINYDWPSWAARIRAGEAVVVPINPDGFTFTYPGRAKPK